MMKKISIFAAVTMLVSASFAQKYDAIKNSIAIGKYDDAKKEFDKASSNEKFFSKPEGYLSKSALYAGLALDSSKAAEAEQNRTEAYNAFEQYKQADPTMKDLDGDPIYKNTPFSMYASYYNSGVADINSKNYDAAYEKFQKVVELSDLLIAKKINLPGPIDTAALYYAGILAEQTKHLDDAAKYNTRLADAKVSDSSYEQVYQSLLRYYASKNDNTNFEKYRVLGKELYPNSEYFTYSMVDFAVGSGGDFNEKVANLEKVLAANPEDFKANLALAEVIYDTLDSRKEGAVPPANADELEQKMLTALNKAASLNPNELQPVLLLGDHYILKSDKVGEEMRAAETVLDTKGSKATAAEKQKFADAKKKYDEAYDLAKDNFLKAIGLFEKTPDLDTTKKRQYRIVAGNLANYYNYKKDAANEKKFNDLYDSLK